MNGRITRRCTLLAGWIAMVAIALIPASAGAQYVAPPPDPGFEYIFDGSPTGSDASFDKWMFASSTAAASATQGQATLDPVEGSFLMGASPFGAYWYPVRPLGDAVIKLQYTVQNTPESTRNGGIMIRAPEVRYTGATTTDVLAQKPTGYNFDFCPGALPICGRTTPGESTTYTWAGAEGPFPPAGEYSGTYCARNGPHDVTNLAGTGPLTTNSNANNHQHWTQVYCGHEIQINETLTGGGPQPSSDPIKTGSVYGFRNLNAKQSKTNERLTKGVWHDMEIRTVGQQYTVLIDGELINQFDNSVPKIASRNGDPPTMARQLAAGYLGLQTHGGNDRISYREIQVKDLSADDRPVNVEAPRVGGPGRVGLPLTCGRGEWENTPGADFWVTWYRSNPIGPEHPRFRAPSQLDLGNFSTPAEPEFGTQNLTWTDSLVIGHGTQYRPTAEDIGKVIHCSVSANNGGATVWKTARAPEITAR
jgi:3-keto-disaccharide hydrolase